MRKALIGIGVMVAIGFLGWFAVGGAELEVSWCPNWPETVRGVGEATERIVAGPDGKITEADRERASERARWKAYYFAQLRLAEQLNKLEIDASTTLKDMELTDQELVAAFDGAVRGAAEVERETRVAVKKDVATAHLVVEAPAARVMSLREAVISALRAGKIRLSLAGKSSGPAGEERQAAVTSRAEAAQTEGSSSAKSDRRGRGAKKASEPAATGSRSTGGGKITGTVVVIDPSGGFVGVSPTFYDASGRELGSALDLPAERLAAGIPVASSSDGAAVREWAGSSPVRRSASVSKGNVVLRERLDEEQATLFREHLRSAKLVLVLTEGKA